MTAALIKLAALVAVFMAGRAWEARDRLRTLEQNERPLTARDLMRLTGGNAPSESAGRLSERAIEAAIIAGVLILVAPVVFVALHPLWAPRNPHEGKFDLRVIAPAVAEASR